MNRKNRIVLEKMLKYAQDSRKYLSERSYAEFIDDEKDLVFSIFCLSQMGELVRIIDKDFIEKNPQIPWKELNGLRNRIVHDYEGVQYKIIWNILTQEMLPLIEKLGVLLGKQK